jgi:hypothetical protein
MRAIAAFARNLNLGRPRVCVVNRTQEANP